MSPDPLFARWGLGTRLLPHWLVNVPSPHNRRKPMNEANHVPCTPSLPGSPSMRAWARGYHVCTCVVCMFATWSKVKCFGSGLECTVREEGEVTSRQGASSISDSKCGSGGRTRTNTLILSPLQKRNTCSTTSTNK